MNAGRVQRAAAVQRGGSPVPAPTPRRLLWYPEIGQTGPLSSFGPGTRHRVFCHGLSRLFDIPLPIVRIQSEPNFAPSAPPDPAVNPSEPQLKKRTCAHFGKAWVRSSQFVSSNSTAAGRPVQAGPVQANTRLLHIVKIQSEPNLRAPSARIAWGAVGRPVQANPLLRIVRIQSEPNFAPNVSPELVVNLGNLHLKKDMRALRQGLGSFVTIRFVNCSAVRRPDSPAGQVSAQRTAIGDSLA